MRSPLKSLQLLADPLKEPMTMPEASGAAEKEDDDDDEEELRAPFKGK